MYTNQSLINICNRNIKILNYISIQLIINIEKLLCCYEIF